MLTLAQLASFVAVAEGPAGARFIAPSPDEAARIRAKHAFLKPLTVAPGSYPGQTAPIESVGSWSFIMARPGLDDDRGQAETGDDSVARRKPPRCRLDARVTAGSGASAVGRARRRPGPLRR